MSTTKRGVRRLRPRDVSVSVRTPKSPGMKVTDIVEQMPINELYTPYQSNTVRYGGESEQTVAQFKDAILNGYYYPRHFDPPTVEVRNGQYELVTGFNRKAGHEAAGESTMYVAVVEFKDHKGQPATYWRNIWALRENDTDHKVIKFTRSNADVYKLVANMFNDGLVERDDQDIRRALKDAGIKSPNKLTTMTSHVWNELGVRSSVVQSYHQFAKESFLDKYKELVNRVRGFVREIIAFTCKGGSGINSLDDLDYDNRLVHRASERFVQDPDTFQDVIIAGTVNGAAEKKVRALRERKKPVFARAVAHWREVIRLIDYGYSFDPTIKWLPQLHGEDKTYKETKDLISDE